MVGTREEPGHEAALLDAEGLRHRLVATEVDHEAEGFEGERPPLALPERGGHVARDVVALAHGVLGGRGAPAVGVGGVGDRCAVADRPDVLASLDLRALVDPDPALLVQRSRGRGYPRCPNDGPRRHLLAGGELDAGFRDPLQPRSRPHLDAAPPELGGREPREVLGYLAHDPVVRLHQQPAGPLGGAARVQVEYLRRQILHLRDRLDSRVAAAGDHEGEVLLADDRVVDGLGHLEVPQQRVAHVERLDELLNPTARSPSPGIGRFLDTDPSATMSWSYGSSTAPPSTGTKPSLRRSGSQSPTRPSRRCASPSCSRMGSVTWRGLTAPPATAGSSGE